MGAELGRILTAAGAVAAWTGIIVLGLGMAELTPGLPFAFGFSLVGLGTVVTVVGLVALVLGVLILRGAEPTRSPR